MFVNLISPLCIWVADSFGELFWNICNYVFYCFRFVELIIAGIDFLVIAIKTLLNINTYLITSILNLCDNGIKKCLEFKDELLTSFSSFGICCYKVMWNSLEILADWLSSIPENVVQIFIVLREYGFEMFMLVTKVMGGFMSFLVRKSFNGFIHLSVYPIYLADICKSICNYLIVPCFNTLVVFLENVPPFLMALINGIHQFFLAISSNVLLLLNYLWNAITFIPYTLLSLLLKGIRYAMSEFLKVAYVIFELFHALNVVQYLFEILVIILICGFIIFLYQMRNIQDFYSVRRVFQHTISPTALFQWIHQYFDHHQDIVDDINSVIHPTTTDTLDQNDLMSEEERFASEDNTTFEATNENNDNNMNCVVCHDRKKSILLLPCKHLCACDNCITFLLNRPILEHKCPLCRRRIQDYMHVFL